MSEPEEGPRTREEALATGYLPIPKGEEPPMTEGALSPLGKLADCAASPSGTKCFDYVFPDGSHMVGFCSNGRCEKFRRA